MKKYSLEFNDVSDLESTVAKVKLVIERETKFVESKLKERGVKYLMIGGHVYVSEKDVPKELMSEFKSVLEEQLLLVRGVRKNKKS